MLHLAISLASSSFAAGASARHTLLEKVPPLAEVKPVHPTTSSEGGMRCS